MVRLSETSRINEREVIRLDKRAKALRKDFIVAESIDDKQKMAEINDMLLVGEKEIIDRKTSMKNSVSVLEWLAGELFDNMYPGTVFEREVSALELLHCAIDSTADNKTMKNIFFTASMTKTLLNLLLSSWDKSRRLAADLLFKFPRPLPCYTTSVELVELVDRGCRLGNGHLLRGCACIYTFSSMSFSPSRPANLIAFLIL